MKCQVANLSLRSRAKNFFVRRFIDGGRKLGCCQKTGNPLDSIALARPASTKESGLEICDRRRDTMPPCASLFPTEKSPPLSLILLRNCLSPEKRFTRLPFNDFENENKRPPFNRGRGRL